MQTAVFSSIALPAFRSCHIHAAIVVVERDAADAAQIITGQRDDGSLSFPVHDVSENQICLARTERGSDCSSTERSQTFVCWKKSDFTGRVVQSSRKEYQRQIVAVLSVIGLGTFQAMITVTCDFKDRRRRSPCAFLHTAKDNGTVGRNSDPVGIAKTVPQ